MNANKAVGILCAAFPQKGELSKVTEQLYVEKLSDIPGPVLAETVDQIINTARFFPSIADIRHKAAEVAGLLPLPAEEALAIVRRADVREDIYRRDGSFAYTERYWKFPPGLSGPTLAAIHAAFAQCGDIVGKDGKDQFGWEQGFKASYHTTATEIERQAIAELADSRVPQTLLTQQRGITE